MFIYRCNADPPPFGFRRRSAFIKAMSFLQKAGGDLQQVLPGGVVVIGNLALHYGLLDGVLEDGDLTPCGILK